MGNVTLAFHLLCERASPSSFWLPYIRSLPQEYHTPLYYQQGEVELLLGTQAVHDFLNQYKNTARQYAYFYKLIQVGGALQNTTRCITEAHVTCSAWCLVGHHWRNKGSLLDY